MKTEAPGSAPAANPSRPSPAAWRRTFLSLRNRNFRWFWLGSLAGFTAMQMEMLTRGWLVYRLTGSALALGATTAASGIPMLLLAPLGGVVTDRVNKRNLLLFTQAVVGLIVLVLASLILSGVIQLWHLLVLIFLFGAVWTFTMPGRQSFVPELVGSKELMNAIAINSAGMNLTRIGAPALAGYLVGIIDVGGVYLLMAGLYAVVVFTLFRIPAPLGANRRSGESKAILADMTEGFGYLHRHLDLLSLISLEMALILFVMPYMIFMPIFADRVFGVGVGGLGLMMGLPGIGALAGSLTVAALGNFRRKGLLVFGAAVAMGIGIVFFTATNSFVIGLVILTFIGLAGALYMAVNNTLILSRVAPEMRGRVMSIYMMTWGMMPFASLPAGALAEAVGVQATLALMASLLVVFCLVLGLVRPSLLRLS